MKKLLLLASALVAGLTSQAQQSNVSADLKQLTTKTTTGDVPVVKSNEKTAKNGDTLSRSHIPASGPLVYYYVGTSPFDSGTRAGFNAYGDKGWAERFDISGKDSSVLPIAVFGYVFGRSTATSTKTLRAGIWSQGSKTSAGVTGRPKLFFDGVPTTLLQSTTISFPSLRESTTTGVIDTVILMRFPTVGAYVTDSFFAGFDIPAGYTWSSLNGDTLNVVQDTAGVRYGDRLAVSPIYRASGGDTIFNVQNAVLSSAGKWNESYAGGGTGLYNNFFIGVVFRVRTLSVEGITRNDMTVYGAVPNPAVNRTTLKLSLQVPTQVMMQVTDINGRTVYTSPAQQLGAGAHDLPISTENLAAGTYYCLVRTTSGAAIGIEFTVVK